MKATLSYLVRFSGVVSVIWTYLFLNLITCPANFFILMNTLHHSLNIAIGIGFNKTDRLICSNEHWQQLSTKINLTSLMSRILIKLIIWWRWHYWHFFVIRVTFLLIYKKINKTHYQPNYNNNYELALAERLNNLFLFNLTQFNIL